MARAKTEISKAEAEVKQTEATAVTPAPKFTVERLRRDCLNLFGVTFSTFDGAVYGLTGKYSIEEMRDRIKTWQGGTAVPAIKVKKEVS